MGAQGHDRMGRLASSKHSRKCEKLPQIALFQGKQRKEIGQDYLALCKHPQAVTKLPQFAPFSGRQRIGWDEAG